MYQHVLDVEERVGGGQYLWKARRARGEQQHGIRAPAGLEIIESDPVLFLTSEQSPPVLESSARSIVPWLRQDQESFIRNG